MKNVQGWSWALPFVAAPALGVLSLVLPVWIQNLPLEQTSPLFPTLGTGVEHLSGLTVILLVISGAILGGAFSHPASWVASMTVMACMPLVALADALADPTSHNLLPLELALYGVLSMASLAGAGVGVLARRALVRAVGRNGLPDGPRGRTRG